MKQSTFEATRETAARRSSGGGPGRGPPLVTEASCGGAAWAATPHTDKAKSRGILRYRITLDCFLLITTFNYPRPLCQSWVTSSSATGASHTPRCSKEGRPAAQGARHPSPFGHPNPEPQPHSLKNNYNPITPPALPPRPRPAPPAPRRPTRRCPGSPWGRRCAPPPTPARAPPWRSSPRCMPP